MSKLFVVLLIAVLVVACGPSAGQISGASEGELKDACWALKTASWDYWGMDILRVGGRTMEVAADIHTTHPGPAKTKSFCEKYVR